MKLSNAVKQLMFERPPSVFVLIIYKKATRWSRLQFSDWVYRFVYFPNFFSLSSHFRMQQPPLSGSGSTCLPRRQDLSSPTPSDDSDSDISLGTHSPVPSSLSLQHSPGSTSGGGNDRDDRLQEDRDKDYRSFSLSSFRFDTHSPGMAGE